MHNIDLILEDVTQALKEDIGTGDITAALIPEDAVGCAQIISREPMLVCGLPWAKQVFSAVNPRIFIECCVQEGTYLQSPTVLVKLEGPVRGILTAERTALNFLQTLSGIATETKRYVDALVGTKTQLLDTRKTLPGLRHASKYAVRCAGGVNHRMGLYDAVLIKENHIKAAGSIEAAVAAARANALGQWIEVEVESLEELEAALRAAPDRILLDNFDVAMLKAAVARRGTAPILLEASGGVNLSSLSTIAKTGVDYISVGGVTKSVRAIDLSLLLDETDAAA